MICTAARGRAAWLCVMIGLAVAPACATARAYPRAVVDRPLVLPDGLARAGIDASAPEDGRSLSTTYLAAIGLAEDIEVEASDEVGVQASSADARTLDQAVGLAIGVMAFQRGPVYAALRMGESYDLTHASWQSVSLGIEAWLSLGRVLVGLRGQELALPVTGDGGATAILPLSAGVQLTPTVFAGVDTDLPLTPCSCDALPTSFEVVASALPRLDVLLTLSARLALEHGRLDGRDPAGLIGVRYYAGW
jgi:hypothetical protein